MNELEKMEKKWNHIFLCTAVSFVCYFLYIILSIASIFFFDYLLLAKLVVSIIATISSCAALYLHSKLSKEEKITKSNWIFVLLVVLGFICISNTVIFFSI